MRRWRRGTERERGERERGKWREEKFRRFRFRDLGFWIASSLGRKQPDNESTTEAMDKLEGGKAGGRI